MPKDYHSTWRTLLPNSITEEDLDAKIIKNKNSFRISLEDAFLVVNCNACNKPLLESALLKHLESCIGFVDDNPKTNVIEPIKKINIPPTKKRKISSEHKAEKQGSKSTKEKESKKFKIPLPLNLDVQCGVMSASGPCTRSISCKNHQVMAKRQVLGRSNTYDVLFNEYQARSRKSVVVVPEPTIPTFQTSEAFSHEEDIAKIIQIIQNHPPKRQGIPEQFSMSSWSNQKVRLTISEVFQR
ncbi:SCA7, zinc-binding domain-containing protein [Globomyces pollinis-pini]|nr:SCA7, zinc-binding domain-containing protein [Globomyces pollinis-pini]